MLAWWTRSIPLYERCRARYGKRFTLRLLQTPPSVHLSDPAEVKEVFTAPPEVLHPGEGARVLEPVVGANSVILLDERAHLSQRKLMLPAFHGERMEALTGLLEDVTEREVAAWPTDEALALHPRLQGLTMEVILRAVFGLDPGPRLDAIRERLATNLEMGARPGSMLPFLQRGRLWEEFVRRRDETDALLFELIDERRAEPDGEQRDDVLTMLLEARHEDGSPMSKQELRDELMTLLVAGHETTASELAWAFERLARTPERVAAAARGDRLRRRRRLPDRDDPRDPAPPAGDPQRRSPPHEGAGRDRRLQLPRGRLPDPERLPDPPRPGDLPRPVRVPARALPGRVARHLHVDPIRRRAAALPGRELRAVEMKIVLRAVLSRTEPAPAPDIAEGSRRRAITLSPRHSAVTVLRARVRDRAPVPA